MPVSVGKKTGRKSCQLWNLLGVDSIEPKLPALMRTQINSAAAMMNMNGAAKPCRKRIDSTPRQTTTIFSSQKPRKQAHSAQSTCATEGQITTSME